MKNSLTKYHCVFVIVFLMGLLFSVPSHADNSGQVYITGTVLSVTADGVLLRDATIGARVLKNVVTGRNPLDGRPWGYEKRWVTTSERSEEPIFLYGVTGLIDGQKVEGVSYKAENYQYTAVNGAVKTVLGFRNR